MRRAVALALVFLLGSAALPPPAHAEIWRYTDERGVNHYVDGLDRVPQRYRAAARPMGLRNAPPPPPGAPPATTAGPGGSTQIKFTPGQRIIADVSINDGTPAKLLLDTGADKTLIKPDVLRAAGISLIAAPSGPIQGVTGSAQAQAAQVRSLAVGAARVGSMVVIAHDMEQAGFDGLLGRDFLEQFKVTIDSSAGVVTIDPK
jgi:hypothetical protein